MSEQISIRGRAARRVVDRANHLPFLKGSALELRMKLSEREHIWRCPSHLELEQINMGQFHMELLHARRRPDTGQPNGIILQLHGGGYYGKLKNVYRDMAGLYWELSKGLDVLSVDYRVAPEHPYPAALQDAMAAYQWVFEHNYDTGHIYVVGDSAGGGLTLALTMALRDHKMPMPKGLITMSAWTDLTKSGESYKENFDIDPVFGRIDGSMIFQDGYYQEHSPADSYISPIMGDYTGFPPMLMQVGEYEMLLSDTLTVAQKAKDAGVLVKVHVYPGMFHVFQMGQLLYPESKEAWQEAGVFIRRLQKQ